MFIDIPETGPLYIRIDHGDTWSADITIAMVIVPILKQMLARKQGIPAAFLPNDHYSNQLVFDFIDDNARDAEHTAGQARWNAVLEEMVWTFDTIASGDFHASLDENSSKQSRVREGLDYFAKNYFHLWE